MFSQMKHLQNMQSTEKREEKAQDKDIYICDDQKYSKR